MIILSKFVDPVAARLKEYKAILKKKSLPFETHMLLHHWLSKCLYVKPDEVEKKQLAAMTSLTERQISNWLKYARRRILREKIMMKEIDPVQLGFNQSGKKMKLRFKNLKKPNFLKLPKKQKFQTFPKRKSTVALGHQTSYECPPLNLLDKVMTKECISKSGDVTRPCVTLVHLAEDLSLLQLLADVASQRKEEMEAEKSKMEAAFIDLDQKEP
ncbi:homeobox protein TGIF2LX-like [Pelobates fuscus]|uniref:homeobox protein TGIF2LX-like n=1 Tax=Pelobates fuscus TaxID=191477 RepID=UPI002FE44C26